MVVLPAPGAPKINSLPAISVESKTDKIVVLSGRGSAGFKPIFISASQGRFTCWGCDSFPKLISTALCRDCLNRAVTSSLTAANSIRSFFGRAGLPTGVVC